MSVNLDKANGFATSGRIAAIVRNASTANLTSLWATRSTDSELVKAIDTELDARLSFAPAYNVNARKFRFIAPAATVDGQPIAPVCLVKDDITTGENIVDTIRRETREIVRNATPAEMITDMDSAEWQSDQWHARNMDRAAIVYGDRVGELFEMVRWVDYVNDRYRSHKLAPESVAVGFDGFKSYCYARSEEEASDMAYSDY